MPLRLSPEVKTVNSLYIHIPFCRRKCLYCDFYSVAYDENLARAYTDVLCEQIKRSDGQFSTIYIGGGTPTILGGSSWNKLLPALKSHISQGAEFTIEANPESLSKEILKLFSASGTNRLSLGLQSFNDKKLKDLGRIHNAACAQEAVIMAKSAGFNNISIDLIFGIWNESPGDWKEELEKAVTLPVTHISCYGLTYEKGTPLFEMKEKGAIAPLEDEGAARMYEYAQDFLEKKGFVRYEVSNFAKEGFFCKHNLNYWENNPYLGLGASAVSYIDGVRKENIPDAKEYIGRVKAGKDLTVFQEELSSVDRAKETAAVKIRTREGIYFDWFRRKTGLDFCELESAALARLTDTGLISYNMLDFKPAGVSLTSKGFLFSDTVCGAFL